jgi:hydroxymethylpyrimidine/phosphomethylpyrimidine kinase
LKRVPRVLVCAGLEPAGRAGLLADLEAIRESGGLGLGVATSLTAQGARTFHSRPVPAAVVRRQIRALRELGGRIDAVKLGAVPTREHLRAIRLALRDFRGWWVVDPVTRTSRGQPLSTLTPREYLRLAGARVALTPNLPELVWLGRDPRSLVRLGFGAVVVKGGHAEGVRITDQVVTRAGEVRLNSRRVHRTSSKRGTGCRFASAMAVALAEGCTPSAAARRAQRKVLAYLRRAK